MRLVEINTVHYGSTGKIMLQIKKKAISAGFDCVSFSKCWKKICQIDSHIFIGTRFENIISRIIIPITTVDGLGVFFQTKRLIKKLKKIKPDVIHLHNLHGFYINCKLLFNYIKKSNCRVVWTLHDCWTFTGHCPHFTMIKCDKWKTKCYQCPQYKEYPKTFFDRSRKMYLKKKEWFTGVKDLTIVTPSEWLAGLVKQSFLKDYPVKVINNGIDLSIFKPTQSDFRKKYNCENKFIVLGVAFGWGKRKGLDVFVELSKRLNERFQIVLVGTDDKVDKILPNNIISIHRTNNQIELAEIYSVADVFVNPTREENYPTVNMESIACGTPVITFNTGGSPEILNDECGIVVNKEDIVGIESAILEMLKNPISQEKCLEHAKSFDQQERIKEYIELFKGE